MQVADGPQDQMEVAIDCAPWGTCLAVYSSDKDILARFMNLRVFDHGFESGDLAAWGP